MFSVAQIIGWLLLYRYVALFSVVAIEGPISTLIAGYLSSLGLLNFWIAYVVAVSGDLASDAGYYALGRFGRERFVKKYGHYVGIASDGYNSADCGDCRECYLHFSGISLFYLSKSKTRRIAGKRWLRKKQSKVVGERFAISKPRMSPGAPQLFFCMDYPRTTRLG